MQDTYFEMYGAVLTVIITQMSWSCAQLMQIEMVPPQLTYDIFSLNTLSHS